MSLNKSSGNMYSWITHTWNTIKGECPHGCTYCYMHRFGKQNPVHFDEKELKTDLGQGNFIFVGSSCDIFAKSIPVDWIRNTLKHCRDYDNTYLFQSKNPDYIYYYMGYLSRKVRICTTIETNRIYSEIMGNTPTPQGRADAMNDLIGLKKYVTIEPVMDFDLQEMIELIKLCEPEQVNIGADSGNNHLPEPPKEKILELISELRKFTVIAKKTNLERLLK